MTAAARATRNAGTAVIAGQRKMARSHMGRSADVVHNERIIAANASRKAPIATATAACHATKRGEWRKLKCSYATCAANATPQTTQAARRHPCTCVTGAANTRPTMTYRAPSKSAAGIHG